MTPATVTVQFSNERHGVRMVSAASGAEFYSFSQSTRRGDHTVHARAYLPGSHDFSVDRGDSYGASMEAAKRQALHDLETWFKVTFGLDVTVIEKGQ